MEVFNVNLVIIYMLITLHFVRPDTRYRQFSRVDNMENKVCLSTDRIPLGNLPGNTGIGRLLACMYFCTDREDCQSVFYNSLDFTCTRCTDKVDLNSALEESVGTSYYVKEKIPRYYQQACSNPEDHCVEPNQECFTDTCICSPGYSYDPGTSTCVDSCTSYGTTFQVYPGWGINGNNLELLRGLSVQECMDVCIASSTQCLSFDYGLFGAGILYCNIAAVTAKTAQSDFVESGVNDNFYARDCA